MKRKMDKDMKEVYDRWKKIVKLYESSLLYCKYEKSKIDITNASEKDIKITEELLEFVGGYRDYDILYNKKGQKFLCIEGGYGFFSRIEDAYGEIEELEEIYKK